MIVLPGGVQQQVAPTWDLFQVVAKAAADPVHHEEERATVCWCPRNSRRALYTDPLSARMLDIFAATNAEPLEPKGREEEGMML